MSKPKPYKLYASYNNQIADGVEYSLQPFGAKYTLCFTDKKLTAPYREIPPETPLTEQERTWLTGCKIAVNAKYMRQNESEFSDTMNLLLNAVEKELAEEKKKMEGQKKDNA